MEKTKKRRLQLLAASVFWLGVWQAAAMAIGQEVFLVSPVQALGTLVQLLPQAEFWQRVAFSAGRILLGFGLGALSSTVLAVAAEKWEWVDALLAPVMQLVKATPVASFIILALVWVSGSSLSVLISFLMVLPVLYGAVRTGIGSADRRLLEMAQVFRLPLGRRLRAVWLPAEQYNAKTQYKEQIRKDLIQLGLDDEALALPARKLSGGQKRRTALLRALWAESDTLLLDEPFTGMDPAAMKKAAAMLKARCGAKPALLATHDQLAIWELGWRVIELG